MSVLTLEIEIADEPLEGFQLQKLTRLVGQEVAPIAGRIVGANRERFPPNWSPDKVLLRAVCEAVHAAESSTT